MLKDCKAKRLNLMGVMAGKFSDQTNYANIRKMLNF
jgi:hypothetical protein